ncbi:MAG: TVP38/TMEM64 family protein [Candidatus Coproplasma sp.]
MKTSSKIIVLTLNALLCALIVICASLFMDGWSTAVRVICCCVAGVGFIFELVVFLLKKEALFKSGFVLIICASLVVGTIAIISKVANLAKYPTDGEKIDRLIELIQGLGGWGYLVYFLIQVLQVVILPLPAAVCYIPGSLVFGAWQATLVATAGVFVGSVISYFIGKVFGKRAVVWIAGKDTVEKYSSYLTKHCKVLFVLMQILPFFPDDVLCMLAGVMSMNFVFYISVIIIVRPAIIALYCFLGNGTLIPFSGWGIPVWIAIFAVCIVLAVLSFKYQDRFEKWLISKFTSRKKSVISKNENVPSCNKDGENEALNYSCGKESEECNIKDLNPKSEDNKDNDCNKI